MAKRCLSERAHPVSLVPAEALRPWMAGAARAGRIPISARLDPGRIDRADPKIPLIFLDAPREGFLIDGHHRLECGRRMGVPSYPVVVIRDPADARAISRPFTRRLPYWWLWRGAPRGRRPREGARGTPGIGASAAPVRSRLR